MGMSIVKAFSLLVASGHGSRCNELRDTLHRDLIATDSVTGLPRVYLHKSSGAIYAKDKKRVGKELFHHVKKVLVGIECHYYGPDQPTTPIALMN